MSKDSGSRYCITYLRVNSGFLRFRSRLGQAAIVPSMRTGHGNSGETAWAETIPVVGTSERAGIVALNTAWTAEQGGEKDRGRLYVGSPQFALVHRLIQDSEGVPDLVICLMHHPPSWLHRLQLSEWCAAMTQYCDLVLCGHQHVFQREAQGGYSLDTTPIFGTGALAEQIEENSGEEVTFNLYQCRWPCKDRKDVDNRGTVSMTRYRWDGNLDAGPGFLSGPVRDYPLTIRRRTAGFAKIDASAQLAQQPTPKTDKKENSEKIPFRIEAVEKDKIKSSPLVPSAAVPTLDPPAGIACDAERAVARVLSTWRGTSPRIDEAVGVVFHEFGGIISRKDIRAAVYRMVGSARIVRDSEDRLQLKPGYENEQSEGSHG